MAHQDNQVQEEGPNGSDDRITAQPTDNREGGQAYPYYTHALGTSQWSMLKV